MRILEQLSVFARCRIRNKTNKPTKSTLQVFVRVIRGNLSSVIHLHFETNLRTYI